MGSLWRGCLVSDEQPPLDTYLVDGHQIRGYELLERRVSQANKSSGRIVLPISWSNKRVKLIAGGEVIEIRAKPSGKQVRVNIHPNHIGETVRVIRIDP